LLVVDNDVFEAVVPFLVLFAAALLAVPDRWLIRLRPRHPGADDDADGDWDEDGDGRDLGARRRRPGRSRGALVAMALAGAYGAYFGGALGVVLLAFLTVFVGYDLSQANAFKNTLSLLINTVALVVFIGLAPVDWPSVAVGAPASLAGALVGGAASARIDARWLRWGIVLYALVAGIVLLVTG
jgi:uncharacterized membrane protein YfcA